MDFVIIQGEWRGERAGQMLRTTASSLLTHTQKLSFLAVPEVRRFVGAGFLAALGMKVLRGEGDEELVLVLQGIFFEASLENSAMIAC